MNYVFYKHVLQMVLRNVSLSLECFWKFIAIIITSAPPSFSRMINELHSVLFVRETSLQYQKLSSRGKLVMAILFYSSSHIGSSAKIDEYS
jgi:hypothetical protein